MAARQFPMPGRTKNEEEMPLTEPRKESSLMLRMIIISLSMVCGVYITSICLRQSEIHLQLQSAQLEGITRPCHASDIPPSEIPFLHYPEPVNYSREECACTPVRFFAILSMQRSGSGWFETLLNSHINISSNGEIFSDKERRSNMSSITQTLDKVYNLDWYNSAAKNECTAAVGLKWMLNQGLLKHHEEIAGYFNRRGVSAIFLFRRNLLRRMVSVLANSHDRDAKLLNGKHKSHVHSKDEAILLARYKPLLNTTSLIADLKQTESLAANALKYFNTTHHIVLFYEEIVKNQTKLMDVLEFLKVPQRTLISRQQKIHIRPLSRQIENWEAVYGSLKGTEYENFLNADYQF